VNLLQVPKVLLVLQVQVVLLVQAVHQVSQV